MNGNLRVWTLAISLVFVVACKKNKAKDGSSPAAVTKQNQVGSQSDSASLDSLWALAPAGSMVGVVLAPGSATRLQAMLLETIRVIEMHPLGKNLGKKLREESASEKFDVLDPSAASKVGIDTERGAALFMLGKDDGLLLLPISDRGKFRELTGAQVMEEGGNEFDRLDADMFCTMKGDYYVCMNSIEKLSGFQLAKTTGPLAQSIARLPAGYRGDVEIAADLPKVREHEQFVDVFDSMFANAKLGYAALKLGEGAVDIRAFMEATPKSYMEAAKNVSNSLADEAAKRNHVAHYHLRVPVGELSKHEDFEDQELPGGLSLKNDVIANLTGEILLSTPPGESLWGQIAVGIADKAPFEKLLTMGCGMLPAANIPGLSVKAGESRCDVLVDVAKLPIPDKNVAAMFEKPIPLAASIDDTALRLTIGTPQDVTGTNPAAKEFLQGWNFSVLASSISIGAGFARHLAFDPQYRATERARRAHDRHVDRSSGL